MLHLRHSEGLDGKETANSCEMLVPVYQTTCHHIPNDKKINCPRNRPWRPVGL
jgi:hypothetical protein